MSGDTLRSVGLARTAVNRYVATNARGGTISIGNGDDDDFSPVELLLAAIGGCTAVDVDVVTSRRTEPTEFTVAVRGDKIRNSETGNRMENLEVEFIVRFPDGDAGDQAREILPRAVRASHERLCTVSRTVEIGTPIKPIIN